LVVGLRHVLTASGIVLAKSEIIFGKANKSANDPDEALSKTYGMKVSKLDKV